MQIRPWLVIAVVTVSTTAAGKNLTLLVDTLSGNFFAQQVSTMCSVDNPHFGVDASGKLGNASAYAAIVKEEIVSNLPRSDADALVREAAQSARSDASQLIQQFSTGGNVDIRKLQQWCMTTGLTYIRNLQIIYDEHQDEFEKQLNVAKE